MSVNASGRPALPKLAGALPSITVTQVLLQLSITATEYYCDRVLLQPSITATKYYCDRVLLRPARESSESCSHHLLPTSSYLFIFSSLSDVVNEDHAVDDAEDSDAVADGDGEDADGDGGVLPPAGTPRASCQLTLLTSPARVTRGSHCGDDDFL